MADRAQRPRRGPVRPRVQRDEHQVVEDGRAHEPQHHPEPVPGEQPHPGVPGERERTGQQQD
ncbi:hypothetical protein ACFXC8_56005, partial [Streptomyces sp. NPDC059441]|uniref:hypothetical protein n=1 Tax=Streptomyces sp. NPDC059441 TaxID=3346829 RepID=UPI0036A63B98